jgi:hypothetical protein
MKHLRFTVYGLQLPTRHYLALFLVLMLFPGLSLSGQFHRVIPAQSKRTTLLLHFLEQGQSDSVLKYVDAAYLKQDTTLASKLKWASEEIRKVKAFTQVSNGLIVYKEDHNVYYCVYETADTQYVAIAFHYLDEDTKAMVVQIDFENKTALMEAKRRNREAMEEMEQSGDIPPPPPPPAPPRPRNP